NGFGTAFEGWTGNEPQSGWTIVDNQGNGQTWRFDDPGNRGNLTGGGGNFAVIDSGAYGPAKHQDTSLVSPVTDLSGMDSPKISFDTDYEDWLGDSASVDVSVDGGQTWTNIWHKEAHGIFNGHVEIPIPSAANQSQVQLRFHYIGFYSWFWEIDNVVVGNRSCDLTDGGLVAGIVTDHNTGDPVDGATVTSDVNDDEFGVTTQTPEDANLSDGYYWLFSSHAGRTGFTGSKGQYAPTSDTVDVPVDYVQHTDLELRAGHLTIDKSSIKATERMGRAKSRTLTFGNDGTEPVHVQLGETVGGFTALNGQHLATTPGAPKQVVKTQTSVAALVSDTKQAPVFGNQAKKSPPLTVHGQKVQLRRPVPADRAWSPIADYPKPVMDDAVAYHNGKVYVVGGSDGSSTYSDAYVYDPSAQSWSAIADLPEALSAASAVFVGDTLYVVGGWDAAGDASSHAYAYDPGSDSWTQLADMPGSVSAAGLAALQGKLYVVGGCTNGQCTSSTDSVHSYDPGSNTWSEEPAYPTPVSFTACGGIGGEVVCAGGVNSSTSLTATYALVPGSGSWTQKADLPMDAWAASYAAANGELEVMGGAINNGHALTNQGYAYDPAADEWAGLPSSNNAVYRGGAACGLFKVGGFTGRNSVAFGETLPGYGNCGGGGDVAWLSQSKAEFDVAPGDSVTVRVSLDSGAVSKPGDYRAKVGVSANTPYQVEPVDVAMHVQPPRRWGKVAGTVTDTEGNPLAGATVQICTMWDRYLGCGPVTYTLKTDADGHYQLWLNQGYNPLAIIVAKPGYQPKFELTRIHRGETTTANFTLAGT
ncbi:MAG: Kelch repeat-containing protein, partial [Nocardioidaceae bacterium]